MEERLGIIAFKIKASGKKGDQKEDGTGAASRKQIVSQPIRRVVFEESTAWK